MFLSKALTKTIFLLVLGMTTNVVISNSATAQVKIFEDCRYNKCFELYFIKKTKTQKTQLGQLYSVKLEHRAPQTGELLWAFDQQVFCSTSRPAVAFKSNGMYYVDFINPGGEPAYNAIFNSYAVYWATCHNFTSQFGSHVQARKFGYPLNHKQRQERMKNLNQLIYR